MFDGFVFSILIYTGLAELLVLLAKHYAGNCRERKKPS
jgi:hypothetical protein